MKYLDEFGDPDLARSLLDDIAAPSDSTQRADVETALQLGKAVAFRADAHVQDFLPMSKRDILKFEGCAAAWQRALTSAGIPIAVATSKPKAQTDRILEHFGLTHYFASVAGASEDEQYSSKADIVGAALGELTAQGVDVGRAIMVGDRIYDVEGSAAHGVPSIIVEWGYGSPEEARGALATVYSADQLREFLIG